MYNSLTALLFRVGIKCENHAGSILLLKKLFKRIDLFNAISFAKNVLRVLPDHWVKLFLFVARRPEVVLDTVNNEM
jgi:hypothetical protein